MTDTGIIVAASQEEEEEEETAPEDLQAFGASRMPVYDRFTLALTIHCYISHDFIN